MWTAVVLVVVLAILGRVGESLVQWLERQEDHAAWGRLEKRMRSHERCCPTRGVGSR